MLGFATHRVDDDQDGASVYVRGVAARCGIDAAAPGGGSRTSSRAARVDIQASLAGVAFYRANGFEELGFGEARLPTGRAMPCVFMRRRLG